MKNIYKKGFTLIELLVVISIIGILSSVVLTNLSSTRNKAFEAKKNVELNQIATSLESYYASNGYYPFCPAANDVCCIGTGCVYLDDDVEEILQGLAIENTSPPVFSWIKTAFAENIYGADYSQEPIETDVNNNGYRGHVYINGEDCNSVDGCPTNEATIWSVTARGSVQTATIKPGFQNTFQSNSQINNNTADGDSDGLVNASDPCPTDPDCDDDNVIDGSEVASICIQDPDCDDDTVNDDTDSCPQDATNQCNNVYGCTDSNYFEYNSSANIDDGSCVTLKIPGCTDSTAYNYNSSANFDNGSCQPFVYGCIDSSYLEYNPSANTDNGSCMTIKVPGCTDSAAYNYHSSANFDNGSCQPFVYGCTDSSYLEYNPSANTDNGTCNTLKVYGCTNSNYFEYNSSANTDDGSCSTLKIYGCTDSNYTEYNSSANIDDGSCSTPI